MPAINVINDALSRRAGIGRYRKRDDGEEEYMAAFAANRRPSRCPSQASNHHLNEKPRGPECNVENIKCEPISRQQPAAGITRINLTDRRAKIAEATSPIISNAARRRKKPSWRLLPSAPTAAAHGLSSSLRDENNKCGRNISGAAAIS